MNKSFEIVADKTLDQLEICRICITNDGKYYVPNEKDGKLSLLPSSERKRIAEFSRGLASRLMCPARSHHRKSRHD